MAGTNSYDGDFPTLGYRQRLPDGRGLSQAVVAKVAPVPAGIPVVGAISPRSGPSDGGTAVKITGSDFTDVSAVDFGGAAASRYIVVSSSEITAVAPSGAEGSAMISVTAAAGTSPDNAYARFLYTQGGWRATTSMPGRRAEQTATLLNNGKVLVVGGIDQTGNPSSVPYLYDPRTELWSTAGTPAFPRWGQSATLLDGPACRSSSPPAYCGEVLVAGGDGATNTSAELYDPTTNTWS